MLWIAPSEKDTDNAALEKRLWDAADPFRPKKREVRSANSERQSEARNPNFDNRQSAFGLCRNWTGWRTRQTNSWPTPSRPRKPHEATMVRSPNGELRMAILGKFKVRTSIVELSVGLLFVIGNSSFGLRQVRQSNFVIRHSPAPHDATGRFDFVLANPPFKVNAVDTALRVSARGHPEGKPQDLPERQDHERLKDMVGPGRRFPLGLPRTDNANGGDSART